MGGTLPNHERILFILGEAKKLELKPEQSAKHTGMALSPIESIDRIESID